MLKMRILTFNRCMEIKICNVLSNLFVEALMIRFVVYEFLKNNVLISLRAIFIITIHAIYFSLPIFEIKLMLWNVLLKN